MRRFYHQTFSLLVLAVFLLSALVPIGYMPAFAKDGTLSMVICSDQGPKTVLVDANGRAIDSKQTSHHDGSDAVHKKSPCPYALTALFGDVPASPLSVPPVAVVAASDIILHDLVHWGCGRLLILAPRGPPV